MNEYDVIIIGERGIFGGQIVNARLVENYPGFPEGISGPELGEFMRRQATKYELETLTTEVTGVRTGNTYEVSTTEGNIASLIVLPVMVSSFATGR